MLGELAQLRRPRRDLPLEAVALARHALGLVGEGAIERRRLAQVHEEREQADRGHRRDADPVQPERLVDAAPADRDLRRLVLDQLSPSVRTCSIFSRPMSESMSSRQPFSTPRSCSSIVVDSSLSLLRSPSRPRASSARSWRPSRSSDEPGEQVARLLLRLLVRLKVFAPLGQQVAALAGFGVEQRLHQVVQLDARGGALAETIERRGRVLVRRLADREHRQGGERRQRKGDTLPRKRERKLIVRPCPKTCPTENITHPPGAAAMIRIAIIDDHAIVRAGLRQFFSEQVDLTVVAEASNGREAVDIVRKGAGRRPRHGPLDARPERRRRARRDQGARARPAGADSVRFPGGALRDDTAAPGGERLPQQGLRPEEIVKAIRTVYRGRKYITAGVAELLADGLGGGGDKPAHEQLSEREFQVFLRLAKGETIGHMANSMSLSVKTVSTYRTRVMEKMKLESNSDLTYYALKNGLIQ